MTLFRRIIKVLSVCSVVTTFGTVFVQAEHGTGETICKWGKLTADHGNSLSGNNITCDCVDGHWRNCGKGCSYKGNYRNHGERLTGETKSYECNDGKWIRGYDKDNQCQRDGTNYPAGAWYELPHTNEKCYCEWDTTWSQCEALHQNPDSSPTSTRRPTSKPTDKLSSKPSLRPTPQPTPPEWTGSPTKATPEWTGSPTKPPSPAWTGSPTKPPSPEWTGSPTPPPSRSPTLNPTPRTPKPTPAPITPDTPPSPEPTPNPTQPPTRSPTLNPSARPSRSPTNVPSKVPTPGPTPPPSPGPTPRPTPRPTLSPTERPTVPSDGNFEPTVAPTGFPTGTPTELGTFPTFTPSARPSNVWVDENETPTVVPAEFGAVQPVTPSARPLTEGCKTIAEFVCKNDDFSILCAALQRLYLFDILNNKEGQYTFFAPNDTAFQKYLEKESVTEMTEINSDIMKDVLYTNIMVGVLSKANLIVRCEQEATMINMEITRTFCETTTDATDNDDGMTLHQIGVGNSDDEKKPKLIATDINACNGIIHVIDEVILPAK